MSRTMEAMSVRSLRQPAAAAALAGRQVSVRLRVLAGALLVMMLIVIGFIVLTPWAPAPSGQRSLRVYLDLLHAVGVVSRLISFGLIEWLSNVVMFLPVGFLLAIVVPLRRRWWVVAAGALLSIGIELVQGAFLPERVASVNDVLANTTGAALGVLLVGLLTRRFRRR